MLSCLALIRRFLHSRSAPRSLSLRAVCVVLGTSSLLVVVRSSLRFLLSCPARLGLPFLPTEVLYRLVRLKRARCLRSSTSLALCSGDVNDDSALVVLSDHNDSAGGTSSWHVRVALCDLVSNVRYRLFSKLLFLFVIGVRPVLPSLPVFFVRSSVSFSGFYSSSLF